MTDVTQYNLFVSGQNSEPLIEIMGSPKWAAQCRFLLGSGEGFQDGEQEGAKTVLQKERVEEFYYALFALDFSSISGHGVYIGKTWVEESSRNEFFQTISGLSLEADYSN